MSYSQYFGILSQAAQCANRRYFVPEIRALINADNAKQGIFAGRNPDEFSPFWQVHNHMDGTPKSIGLKSTPQGIAATEIGLSGLVTTNGATAHRIARWFIGDRYKSNNPLDDNNQITNESLAPTLPRESITPDPKKHDVRLTGREITDKETIQRNKLRKKAHQQKVDIDRGAQEKSLYAFFNECAHKHKLYEMTPREAISPEEEQALFKECSKNETNKQLYEYARARYMYSEGTNPQYQQEIKTMINSDKPDKVFIDNNLKSKQ